LSKFEEAGVQVVAISYDSVDKLKAFAEKNSIGFTMLSDQGSKTLDAYGIRNKEVKAGTMQDGIPYPGTFLLDKDGVVRAKFFLEGYRERIADEEVLKAAQEIK
jgi:peroxiredoxin